MSEFDQFVQPKSAPGYTPTGSEFGGYVPTGSEFGKFSVGANKDRTIETPASKPIQPVGGSPDEVGAPSGQQGAVIGTPTPLQRSMPNKSFQGFVSNLGKDAGTLAGGIGVLGSALVSRWTDSMTAHNLIDDPQKAISNLGKEFTNPDWQGALKALPGQMMGGATGAFVGNEAIGTKPLFRVLGNQNEPSDIPVAVDMAGNILQDYAKNYIDPALRGDFGAIGERVYEHPGLSTLDLAPALGPAKFVGNAGGKIAGRVATTVLPADVIKAGEVAGIVGGGAVKEAGAMVAQKAASAVASSPLFSKLVATGKTVIESASQWNAINQILAKHDKAFRAELKEQLEWVKESYKKIPQNAFSDEDLTNIVTARDMSKLMDAMSGPHADAISRFMERLNSVNKWIAGKLIDAGAMTDDEAKAATFGPRALKKLQDETGDPNLPHSALTMDQILEAEAELAELGIDPAYLGIIPQPVSKAVRSNAGQLLGGIGRTAKKAALEAEQGSPITERPGFLTPRQKGTFDPAAHEANPLHAFEVRLTESLSFLQIRDALKEIIENPKLAGHGAADFALKAKVERLAEGAGLGHPEWAKLVNGLPEVVKLPAVIAKELDRVMTSASSHWYIELLEVANKIFKTATLGLDMGWAVQQTLQNGLISGWSMFKGSDDFGRSLMAYFMAFDKRAQKVARDWIYDTHGEATVLAEVPKGLAKPGAIVKAYMDTVFGVATAGDNYFRVVKGLHSLMRQIEQAEPASRLPMAKAFHLMERFDQIERAASDAKYAAAAAKDIRNWFFDYGPAMAQKWKDARVLAPFALWWIHSFSLLKTAALETPMKNAILSEIAQYAPDKLQKGVDEHHRKMGMVPLYDADGNPRKGPNDGQLLMGRSGFLPLMQPFELVAQGYQFMTGQRVVDEREGLPPINPLIAFLIAGARNPQNMTNWSDPRLYHVAGKQYRDTPEGPVEIDPVPPWDQRLMRSLLPRQEAVVRDFMASGIMNPEPGSPDYVPSDFTNLSDQAPKRGSNGKPLLNFNPLQRAFYTVTKTKPTEVTRKSSDITAMERRLKEKLQSAKRFQNDRGKPTQTVIGKMIEDKSILEDAKPGPYRTELSGADEKAFRSWVESNKIPFDDGAKSDYDMRGYWKDVASRGGDHTAVNPSDGLPHFPDTYKTPYHHSFSRESKYAKSSAPHWVGDDQRGWKLIDKSGRTVVDEIISQHR